tara:strand:+ start:35 stop:469 length:435 start_codon:yes stop_codon:yes gene_type:complete
MTSQLNVDTIVDKTGNGGSNVKMANTSTYVSDGGGVTQNTVQSLGKAWALLDGTGTIALQDSFNIGAVSDSGTGDYIFTVSNPFVTANYSVTANGRQSESPAWTAMTSSVGVLDTDDVRITSRNTSNTQTDQKQLHTQFMGDLA